MNRFHQATLIVATLGFSWLAMQVVHELGHVLGAALSGGQVDHVQLHPLTISYTRLAKNPRPMLVAWSGPLMGVGLPLAALLIVKLGKLPAWYLVQFFAGFCLVANGAYLAFGSLWAVGDAGDLLHLGTPLVLLWLFGLTTISWGLWLWHGLGPHFGLGESRGRVNRLAAYTMLTLFLGLIVLQLLFA